MVAKAKEELEQEVMVKEDEKDKYLSERAPPLQTSGMTIGQLQVSRSASPNLPS
jgi:troponin-1